MKKSILIICILAIAFCLSGALLAQPDPNSQQNGEPVGGDPLGGDVPVRGGATLLLTFSLAVAVGRAKWPS